MHTIMQHLSFTMIILIFKLSKTRAWNLEVLPSFRCVILDSSTNRGASFNCLNNTNEGNTIYPYNVRWFKVLTDGGLNPISRSIEGRIRSDGHQLRFSSIIAEDEGIYCCKSLSSSTNRGCSQTATTNISVALPPIISYLPDQNVSIGDTVVIECILNYTGKPAANQISWQIFGRDVFEHGKYKILQSSNATSLTIINVTKGDTGSYSCITYNSKHLQDNQSMFLLVNELSGFSSATDNTSSSTSCNMTESYPITIGLQIITGDCSGLQEPEVFNVISHFLFLLCNCGNYCIKVNYVTTCSSDNAFIITNVTIRGEQALSLQNKTHATLRRANTTVEFESNVYYLFCVITELCGDTRVISDNNVTVAVSSTGETKDKIPAQTLIYISVILIMIVIILSILIIIIWVLKSKKNFSQAADSRQHFLSTEVVFEEHRNEIAGSRLSNLKLNTGTHSYEDPDITLNGFNPTYYSSTLTQIPRGSNSNAEGLNNVLQPDSNFCASNDNLQYPCPQASNNIKCTYLPEMQKCMDDDIDVNHKSKENDDAQVINNNNSPTAYYDDTVIAYHDDKTKNHSNYAKLQHTTFETNETPTDENEEIKWVTNPRYNDVPLTHVGVSKNLTAYSSKKTPLTRGVVDEACYEDTVVENSCRNLHSNTENVTLSESDNDKFSSTTWDKDRSSYVTGYSSQFKLPLTRPLTASTYREGGNEVPINPIPAVNICEWNSTNV